MSGVDFDAGAQGAALHGWLCTCLGPFGGNSTADAEDGARALGGDSCEAWVGVAVLPALVAAVLLAGVALCWCGGVRRARGVSGGVAVAISASGVGGAAAVTSASVWGDASCNYGWIALVVQSIAMLSLTAALLTRAGSGRGRPQWGLFLAIVSSVAAASASWAAVERARAVWKGAGVYTIGGALSLAATLAFIVASAATFHGPVSVICCGVLKRRRGSRKSRNISMKNATTSRLESPWDGTLEPHATASAEEPLLPGGDRVLSGESESAPSLHSDISSDVSVRGWGKVSPEEASSWFAQLTFVWIVPTLLRGFRSGKLLFEQLPRISRYDRPSIAFSQFQAAWQRELKRVDYVSPALNGSGGSTRMPSLVRVLWAITGRQSMFSAALLLANNLLSYVTPLCMSTLLRYVQGDDASGAPAYDTTGAAALAFIKDEYVCGTSFCGYVMAIGLFLSSAAASLCIHSFWFQASHAGLRAYSALASKLYATVLRLSPASMGSYSYGKLTNMLGVDAARVNESWVYPMMHWGTWSSVLSFGVALTYLWQLLGAAALVGMAAMLILSPMTGLAVLAVRKATKAVMERRDDRCKATGEALTGIRLLKVYAWEAFIGARIAKARHEEMVALRHSQYISVFISALSLSGPVIVTAVSFATYTAMTGKLLTPSVAFVSLYWFSMLRGALRSLPSTVVGLISVSVSLKRLRDVFLLAERADARQALPPADEAREGDRPGGRSRHGGRRAQESRPSAVDIEPTSPTATYSVPQWSSTLRGCIDLDHAAFSWGESKPDSESGSDDEKTDESKENAVVRHVDATEERPHDVLRDITMHIEPGELVLLVGPIGSGKSSLLAAMTNNLKVTSGVIGVGGRIAYVGQKPWIQNCSVRDNVVFVHDPDEGHYRRVVAACGLDHDIESLRSKDETKIGDQGVTLSGGQKQRLALARAAYSDSDVYILDDVLSAVDAGMAAHLFEQCVCGVMGGRTRVLVTHQLHYLSRPEVDRIVVLGPSDGAASDGSNRVVATGTYEQLTERGMDFAAILGVREDEADGDLGAADGVGAAPPSPAALVRAASGGSGRSSQVDEIEAVLLQRTPSDGAPAQPALVRGVSDGTTASSVAPVDLSTIEGDDAGGGAEDARSGRLSMADLAVYVRALGSCLLPLSIVGLFVVTQTLQLGQNFWLSVWVAGDASKLGGYVTVYLALSLGIIVGSIVQYFTLVRGSLAASTRLHNRMLLHVLSAPLRFFDANPSGRVMNRFVADLKTVDEKIPMQFSSLCNSILSLLSMAAVMAYTTPLALLVLPVLALPYYAVAQVYRWPARDLRRLESTTKSPVFSFFAETVRGLPTIRAFGAERRFLTRHTENMSENVRAFLAYWAANQWVAAMLEQFGCVFILAVAIVAVHSHAAGALHAGQIGLSISYVVQCPTALMWLVRNFSSLETDLVAVERIVEYGRLPRDPGLRRRVSLPRTSGAWDRQLALLPRRPRVTPGGASISTKGVVFRYAPSLPYVLHGIDIDIPAGAKVAVLGRTGSGKSSLLLTLLQLYVSEGQIRIGGELVAPAADAATPVATSRLRATTILQDAVLFSGTIRSNLAGPGGHADDPGVTHATADVPESKMWDSLRRVGLAERVAALPGGLDAVVEENASNFSAGEKQLLALSRALLRPADLYLCDEVTASVDMETDAVVHDVLLSLDATVMSICHRLEFVPRFDMVIVLRDGLVAEVGSCDELLSDEGSLLSAMFRVFRQSGGGESSRDGAAAAVHK